MANGSPDISELSRLIHELAGKPITDTTRLFSLIAATELAFPMTNLPEKYAAGGTLVTGPGDNLQFGGIGTGPDGKPVFVGFTDGAYMQATNRDKRFGGIAAKTVLDWCLRDGRGLIVNSPLGGWIYVTAESISTVRSLCR